MLRIAGAAVVLAPEGAFGAAPPQWNVDYGEDVCSLIRMVAADDTQVAFKRMPGNDMTSINIVKPGWKSLSGRRIKAMRIALQPGGEITGKTIFIPAGEPDGPVLVIIVTEHGFLDRLASAGGLTLTEAGRPAAHFVLPETAKAVAAVRACETEGMRTWGIDPEQWTALRSPPKPVIDLPSLFSSDDYPGDAVATGASGDVLVRLTVDPVGRVSQCFVLHKSGHSSLDKQTCAILARRARFEPALRADGTAVSAPYVTKITWRAG